ncbi:hypothetical protein V6N12_030851 [Hibiscus sabdariffa]|uniref:Uncharacterized protein n=1 Tax=Hibiscus sabdariffa TaxID=183260 RepID=A0ABR2E769_9ROSI
MAAGPAVVCGNTSEVRRVASPLVCAISNAEPGPSSATRVVPKHLPELLPEVSNNSVPLNTLKASDQSLGAQASPAETTNNRSMHGGDSINTHSSLHSDSSNYISSSAPTSPVNKHSMVNGELQL